MGRIFPKGCSVMAKKELQYTPLLGQFMTLSNAVFINRSKRTDAVATFAKVAQTMKKKAVSCHNIHEFKSRHIDTESDVKHTAVLVHLPGRYSVSVRDAHASSL